MRKVIAIVLSGLFISSCSVLRNSSRTEFANHRRNPSENILTFVKDQNLTSNSFFIQKAEIEIVTEGSKQKFIATVKFEKPFKYLISLKSRTGIEGARIFITKDSILINDRLNKKLYFGTSFNFKRKYGLNQTFIPLLFGDIILDKKCKSGLSECANDKLDIECFPEGTGLNYSIDCRKGKSSEAYQTKSSGKEGINFKYDKFFSIGDIVVPGLIELKNAQYNITLKIKIIKVEYPWSGNIIFIPGKGYELIELV